MNEQLKKAVKLFQDFSGHEPETVDTVRLRDNDTAIVVGYCDGILYETVRDGRVEKYIHRFKKKSRPVLAASYDGERLYLLSGAYKFTDRGIVDK